MKRYSSFANRMCAIGELLGTAAAVCMVLGNAEAHQTSSTVRQQLSGPISVEKAVETGLRESLMVRAARADARAAAAETQAAKSMNHFQVSANTYLTHGDNSNILGSSPGVIPNNLLSVPPKLFANQNLTLMVPLYTGGRINNLIRAARERERASSADVSEVRAEIALRIRDAYYRALLAQETAKSVQSRLDADSAMRQTTRALADAGKGIEASVRRVEAEVADAQRALTTVRNESAKLMLDLKAAMGVRLDSNVTLSDTLSFLKPIGNMASNLDEALRNRPELKANRSRLASAESQTKAAKGASQPQVYGAAMADASSPRFAGAYTLGLTISLPLLDGGQRRAETERAQAGVDKANAELQEAELRVAKEVQQAWLDVETAAQNYATALTALISAQAAYEVTAFRVQNQKAILVEQLDALAAVSQARANVAMALYDNAIAIARLRRVIGGI